MVALPRSRPPMGGPERREVIRVDGRGAESRGARCEGAWSVEIHFFDVLDDWMGDYLDGRLGLERRGDGSTLIGDLPDSSAVYGLILRLRDSGVAPMAICARRRPGNDERGG